MPAASSPREFLAVPEPRQCMHGRLWPPLRSRVFPGNQRRMGNRATCSRRHISVWLPYRALHGWECPWEQRAMAAHTLAHGNAIHGHQCHPVRQGQLGGSIATSLPCEHRQFTICMHGVQETPTSPPPYNNIAPTAHPQRIACEVGS